ncbi:histidine protein methyltransferase 1 homolog [Ruditapes philippinarum]|uniref:histidine protein methyltransferase 1 homolog n=1 Tax=Ruditapes philippinarum TaxID=129788 RepID=UPI00295BDE08|nr:histidine protein methyltransferase 1 homolog [Ruditapes philippinarum]
MSFTFNFPDPENSENAVQEEKQEKEDEGDEIDHVEQFREIFTSEAVQATDLPTFSYEMSDCVCIKCVDSQAVETRLCDEQRFTCGVTAAANQHSDLIPNVYEGGLKVWECALDLAEYLCKSTVHFKNKNVLELGCGAGIPAILALLNGASSVHFQDYNYEVIESYTIPNVMLNVPEKNTCTCRYFSGDWDSFRNHMSNQNIQYDVILSAETIYKPENYKKLTAIFEHFLSQDGEIYVAAKSNYFGVGGGTRDFESFVLKAGKFNVETCHTVETGVPREIMKLTRR